MDSHNLTPLRGWAHERSGTPADGRGYILNAPPALIYSAIIAPVYRICTIPFVASRRMRSPSLRIFVAFLRLAIVGKPYSRATVDA
jgi:hypothetical protein